MIISSIFHVHHPSDLLRHQRAWENVYLRSFYKSVFGSFDYTLLWSRCFLNNGSLWIITVYDNSTPVAFVPLFHFHRNGIRFLTGLNNEHCMHACACVSEGYEKKFHDAFFQILIENCHWDVLNIEYLFSFQPTQLYISDETLFSFSLNFFRDILPNYSVYLDHSFDYYISKNISRKLRSTFNRCLKRLENLGDLKLRNVRNVDALSLWKVFLELETSGWKGRAGSSIDSLSLKFRHYYLEFLHILVRYDLVTLHFLELNGRAIAAAFGYTEGDVFHAAKMGYDESFGTYSPSVILTLLIIKYLKLNQTYIRRINLFPWDYGYKHRYINERSFCQQTRIYNNTFQGQLLWHIDKFKRKIRYRHPNLSSLTRSCFKTTSSQP